MRVFFVLFRCRKTNKERSAIFTRTDWVICWDAAVAQCARLNNDGKHDYFIAQFSRVE